MIATVQIDKYAWQSEIINNLWREYCSSIIIKN